MLSNLSTSKAVLARLLAGENLTVVHEKIRTAYFDLNNRSIHCPIWEDMDGALYDLLMAHEVSHALHTPKEGWHDNINEKGSGYKSILNVVEDARIERKIKRMYPGLSKSFAAAYKSLYDRDFFGIKNLKNISKLNLADRINLYFKLGHLMFVPFSNEERAIVREIDLADDWDQIVDISDRVYGLVKKDKELNQDQIDSLKNLLDEMRSQNTDSEESEDDFDDQDASEDSDDEEENDFDCFSSDDGEETESENFSGDQDEEEYESSSTSTNYGNNQIEEDEVQSITDKIFRHREKDLVVDVNDIVVNATMPEPVLENIIMPYEVMIDGWNQIKEQIDKCFPFNLNSKTLITASSKLFRENNNNTINLLVKEFEMRKNASQYARQLTSRSGELDMTRLHGYKLSNDIFKRITVVPKGKNHGLIMYVDMSGSMQPIFGPTLEQLMILVTFCQRVNIPYDVYGFSDSTHGTKLQHEWKKTVCAKYDDSQKNKINPKWICDPNLYMTNGDFHLLHLIGSSMTKPQIRNCSEMLITFAYNYNNFCRSGYYLNNAIGDHGQGHVEGSMRDYGFGLNGTPLTEAILASREMIERFKKSNNLDIVNVIHLTDGEGGSAWTYTDKQIRWNNIPKFTYITDSRTKRRVVIARDSNNNMHMLQQEVMTAFVRTLTGCKHIAYYVLVPCMCSGRQLRYTLANSTDAEFHEAAKSIKNNGFAAVVRLGYDKYLYMKTNDENLDDSKLNIASDATKSKMKSAFIRHMRSKKANRGVCTQFAKEIAA